MEAAPPTFFQILFPVIPHAHSLILSVVDNISK